MSKKIHFIAIGGSAMHNLAIALKRTGFDVSGSDDEIYEPSISRLKNENLLPNEFGWFPEKINLELSAVIVGMHALLDNPELLKAQELGLKIYSYPEYIYEVSKEKQRVVIAGSHGKTTISSLIIHVLNYAKKEFDYLVGAHLDGFDNMVKLSNAPVIIIEGDEYLASPLNRVPKFLQYKHHIAVISGIAWDHVNVFPTFEEYVKNFSDLVDASPKAGALIYNEDDKLVNTICTRELADVARLPYSSHSSKIKDGITYLTTEGTSLLGFDKKLIPIKIFGEHNLYNISAALKVCERIGVDKDTFYAAIQTFTGANNRLEIVDSNSKTIVFRDFAHSPSKLYATTSAVKKQYPKSDLVAVYELHTFSSLTTSFLSQYKGTIDSASIPIIYFNPETIKHKKIEGLNKELILKSFANKNLQVFDSIDELKKYLDSINFVNKNLLLMSSGNFAGLDIKEIAKKCVK